MRPQLHRTFSFGRYHGFVVPAVCQTLSFAAQDFQQLRLQPPPFIVAADYQRSIRTFQATRSVGFGQLHGAFDLRCISAFGLCGPSCTGTFSFGHPHGSCRACCLSVFAPSGPSCSAASASADLIAIVPPAAYQHSAATALAAAQPSVSTDPPAYTAIAARQPSAPINFTVLDTFYYC